MTPYHFLLIAIVLLCFLLVMLILSQNPKGGGLSGTFGGGGSQMFGVERTNNFLDKSTWILASCIALLIIFSVVFTPRSTTNIIPDSSVPTESSETAPTNSGTEAPIKPEGTEATPAE